MYLLFVAIVTGRVQPPVYPACHSDADCYNHPLYRCNGALYNASIPAAVCFGEEPQTAPRCQCVAEAPGDQCGPTALHNPKNTTPALPSYLMVGDSVSLGQITYGKLFDKLENATAVTPVHSPGNACNANRGMHCIHNWTTLFESSSKTLVPCGFDIVSFNFGVHDTSHDQEHLPLDVYITTLQSITNHLLQCKASNGTKLLYVLTTPVPTIGGNASSYPSHCANADIMAYNKAASEIMAVAKIPTLDMFAFMNQHCGLNYETCDWSAGTGNVHPSAMGFEALAGKMFTAVKTLARQ